MRIRATVAAVSGALVLSALAAPLAQAEGSTSYSPADLTKSVQEARQAAAAAQSGRSAFAATADTGSPYALNFTFSNVKVNNGSSIVLGTGFHKAVPVTYKVTHGADVDINDPELYFDIELWRGGSYVEPTKVLIGDQWPNCTATSSTTANCTATIDIYPEIELTNSDATVWNIGGYAIDYNGEDPLADNVNWDNVGVAMQGNIGTTRLKRMAKLTVNASPEPVAKGATVTVSGKLTRADWPNARYVGLNGQSVKLQYRTKTGSYTTLKTITSGTGGALKTTVKATADGYYRFAFAGLASTAPVNATGDYVDVK
ncbi:hypothetical protein [Streptomyces flavalbus]|uniref:Calcium-binding protein n=1 Tax=Streptomyces flavalbus TaxID=2665155 RepID=A0ABW2W8C6_9ACTN